MFLCTLLIGSSCWLGFELVSLLICADIDVYTRVGIGMPCGVILMGWVLYIVNLHFAFSMTLGLVTLSVFVFVSFLLRFLVKRPVSVPPVALGRLVLFVLLPTIFLCWIIVISILYNGTIVRGAVYGDLPFHLNLINACVHGCNKRRSSLFGNLSPFFAGEPLAYPVIVDFVSAIMIGCFDTPLQWAIVIPSLPFTYSLFSVLHYIVQSFSRRPVSVALAPWLFLFLGGLGWTHTFDSAVTSDPTADLVHFWGHQKYEYWFHPILHVLLPQRLSLFSMPICWSYILLLMIGRRHWKIYFTCGLFIGLLPQVQGHSLITLLEWTFAYGFINFPWSSIKEYGKHIRLWLILATPALALSIPQLTPFVGRVVTESFWTLVPIWVDDHRNFFRLWWYGLGVFWVIALFHCFTSLDWRQFKLYIPSLFVFVLSNVIHYQPWNLDNTKVFYNGWVPMAVAVVSHYLATLYHAKFRFSRFLSLFLAVAAVASSIIGLFKAVRFAPNLWNDDSVYRIAQWAIKHSDPKSVWLTDSHHNHPISCLAGRQILIGYRGWLPSHHLNDSARVEAIEALKQNADNTKLIDEFNVDYVCFSSAETSELDFRFPAHTKKWKLVYEQVRYSVWERVKQPWNI
jgi:hypothetical protein